MLELLKEHLTLDVAGPLKACLHWALLRVKPPARWIKSATFWGIVRGVFVLFVGVGIGYTVWGYHERRDLDVCAVTLICEDLDQSMWETSSRYVDGNNRVVKSTGYLWLYMNHHGIGGRGILKFAIDDSTTVHRTVEVWGGRVLHGRSIELHYRLTEKPEATGVLMLILSEDGKHLTGYAVGYSTREHRVLHACLDYARLPLNQAVLTPKRGGII